MSEPMLVIEVGKRSFVGVGLHWSHRHEYFVINGRKDWPKAKGDERFYAVDGRIETLEIQYPPSQIVVKHELRADLRGVGKPTWLSTDEHANLLEGDRSLYHPVYEAREKPPEPVAFTTVKGDRAPRTLPEGISVKAPNHLDVYQWFWWTLPCTATSLFVFRKLAERVKALDVTQFHITIYDNIKHLRVEAGEIKVGGVTYRPANALLWIDTEGTVNTPHKAVVRAIAGDDLDDCLAKVDAWCDAQMAPIMALLAIKDCPCCARPWPKRAVTIRARRPR